MPESKLNKRVQGILGDFVQRLQRIYKDNLVAIVLYGSAASGEYVDEHSNLNLLAVLKNTDLESLRIGSGVINERKFRSIRPVFFTEEYIKSSNDVFPIEFLDMKENYTVLWGKDILKDVFIDAKNLRFQCEQELKVKLITLRQLYLKRNRDKGALKNLLFNSFTSVTHILRNVIRIKGRTPPYLKPEILREVAAEFKIDSQTWEKILAAKNKEIKFNRPEIEQLFINFVRDLEKIINAVDKL